VRSVTLWARPDGALKNGVTLDLGERCDIIVEKWHLATGMAVVIRST
jgi:hypothetical protein